MYIDSLLEKKKLLLSKLSISPNSTGVYFYKDKKGVILYIGKAINIQKRIKSYFLYSPKIY